MKLIWLIILFLPTFLKADIEMPIERQEERIRHSESADQFYLEEMDHKEILPSRLEQTRNQYKENPRNAGFAASFGGVSGPLENND